MSFILFKSMIMNVFFGICFFFTLILVTSSSFSQSIVKPRDSSYTLLEDGRWNLDRYLWSHAKYRAGKYDKSIVDFNAIDNWRKLGNYLSISHNGKYFAYTIERGIGFDSKIDSLIVQSVDSSWRMAFIDAIPGFFTDDGRQYVFKVGTTLCFLQLDGSQSKYVKDVGSFKVSDKGRRKWLAYQLNVGDSIVVLHNLVTGTQKVFYGISDFKFDNSNEWFVCQSNLSGSKNKLEELLLYQLSTAIEKRFSFVVDYILSENGKALLLKTAEELDKGTAMALEYVGFPEGTKKIIWSVKDNNASINSYSMDKIGEQVVFSIRDSTELVVGNFTNNGIWYYKKGMDKAILKVTNRTGGIDERLQIEGSASFTDNGHYIRFFLQCKPPISKIDPLPVQLDVWNHKDLILQSAQSHLLEHAQVYNSIISVESGPVIQLEGEGKILDLIRGEFAIVKKLSKSTYGDRFWEKGYGYQRDSSWLVALNDGSRHLLSSRGNKATDIGPFWFSPSGNYLVYFDFGKECHYFSYDLRTGKVTDVSEGDSDMQLGFIEPYLRTDRKPDQPLGLAAWLSGDSGVLVYDNSDIWQFDLQGRKPAINLTNGFGRSHNIIFSLFNSQRFDNAIPILDKGQSLLLRAFNTKSKYSGFYHKKATDKEDPELLYTGRYFMNMIPWCQDPNLSNKGMPPIKARDANVWIVQRQSDIEAPNYYKTTDFRSFGKLTNFQPQKGYNWFFEELHSFNHLDGSSGQGILYKPENFDSSKKYPVLIVFYGGFSNNLYQFLVPTYNEHTITPGMSPIWFLNNGYLIFTPDIYVTPLKYGQEAFNVIEGAAKYLKQLRYVDGNKLGCCSHSWSAKLGCYILTHSKSFGASAISEGFLYANMINVALSTDEGGVSKLEEVEQGFKFGSLWENRDFWLDQTTVLNVDNASSPLLLLCNKGSDKEYQNQTLQLFTALRRLEKNVWWLKYDKGGHVLFDLDEQRDFTIRYTQFFDHYLKEVPAPRWMTEGIPARLKGFETGYELDPKGSCGKGCKICKRWNEQYEKHPEIFLRPIGEW